MWPQTITILALLAALGTAKASEIPHAVAQLIKSFASDFTSGECSWTNIYIADGIFEPVQIEDSVPSSFALLNESVGLAGNGSFPPSSCAVAILGSKQNLSLSNATRFIESSHKSIMIIVGSNPGEISTLRVLRPIFYLEGNDLHLFCPSMKTGGNWHRKINLWREATKDFLVDFKKDPRSSLCKNPMSGSRVKVAYSGYRDITTVRMKDGSLSGLEIELMKIVANIFNFTPELVRLRQRTLWFSPNDLAVSIC